MVLAVQPCVASPYLRLAEQCMSMAARATHPNNRETLERFAEMWLQLATDELDAVKKEVRRAHARSNYLQDIQRE